MKIGMVSIPDNVLIYGALAIGAAFVLFSSRDRNGDGQGDGLFYGLGYDIGSAPFDMAGGILTGGVVGAGEIVGIPPTNLTQCEKDMAAGRTWDASFSCPATTFLRYLAQ